MFNLKFLKMFNFKLKVHHLFYILLGVLVLSHIGFGVKEYFENSSSSASSDKTVNSATAPKDETSEDSDNSVSGADAESSISGSALPTGISKSDIPEGDEDLYIKKSEIVPPVCPKCPDVSVCPKSSDSKCPPCPPCARCPEPAFECKKVPNYNRQDDGILPRPVLSDFSQFGM